MRPIITRLPDVPTDAWVFPSDRIVSLHSTSESTSGDGPPLGTMATTIRAKSPAKMPAVSNWLPENWMM